MRNILLTAAAGLLLLPLTARAESELALTLQGGGVKYDQALAAPSDIGAQYGVRLGIMPTPVVGVEVGYLGSQSNVRDVVNNSNSTRFISNGAYADARVNVLPGNVMPYLFGGFGVTNFKVDNEVISSDGGLHGRTVATIPFGGGVDFNIGAFKIGGRFQYNYLLTDQLVRSAPTATGFTTGNNTNFYGVNVDLGVSFH
jgi:outer membrane protein with beta-barrel domain